MEALCTRISNTIHTKYFLFPCLCQTLGPVPLCHQAQPWHTVCWDGREGGSKCCVFHVRLQPSLVFWGLVSALFLHPAEFGAGLPQAPASHFSPSILFMVLNKLFPPNCEDFTTLEVLACLSLPGLTSSEPLLASEAGCAVSSSRLLSRGPNGGIRVEVRGKTLLWGPSERPVCSLPGLPPGG